MAARIRQSGFSAYTDATLLKQLESINIDMYFMLQHDTAIFSAAIITASDMHRSVTQSETESATAGMVDLGVANDLEMTFNLRQS